MTLRVLGKPSGFDFDDVKLTTSSKADAVFVFVKTDHDKIGEGGMDLRKNVVAVRNFAHDFDAGLIGKRSDDHFPHEPGIICDENARRLFHINLLAERVLAGWRHPGRSNLRQRAVPNGTKGRVSIRTRQKFHGTGGKSGRNDSAGR